MVNKTHLFEQYSTCKFAIRLKGTSYLTCHANAGGLVKKLYII